MYILTNNQLVVDLFEYLKATTKIYRHAPCRQLLQMSERDAKARIDLESMRSACHGMRACAWVHVDLGADDRKSETAR